MIILSQTFPICNGSPCVSRYRNLCALSNENEAGYSTVYRSVWRSFEDAWNDLRPSALFKPVRVSKNSWILSPLPSAKPEAFNRPVCYLHRSVLHNPRKKTHIYGSSEESINKMKLQLSILFSNYTWEKLASSILLVPQLCKFAFQ